MGKKKQIKKFNKLLLKSNKEVVKICRDVTEGEANVFGVILEISEDFMQIAECNEFKFNGEVIIKLNHVDSIRCNKFDKTYKKILEKEGQLTKANLTKTNIDLSSWKSIFIDLKEADIHVIVECEDLENPTFTIGPIEKVNNKSVKIRYYDPTGQLEKKLTQIKFKDITLLKFNETYSTTFRKYLKKPKRIKEK